MPLNHISNVKFKHFVKSLSKSVDGIVDHAVIEILGHKDGRKVNKLIDEVFSIADDATISIGSAGVIGLNDIIDGCKWIQSNPELASEIIVCTVGTIAAIVAVPFTGGADLPLVGEMFGLDASLFTAAVATDAYIPMMAESSVLVGEAAAAEGGLAFAGTSTPVLLTETSYVVAGATEAGTGIEVVDTIGTVSTAVVSSESNPGLFVNTISKGTVFISLAEILTTGLLNGVPMSAGGISSTISAAIGVGPDYPFGDFGTFQALSGLVTGGMSYNQLIIDLALKVLGPEFDEADINFIVHTGAKLLNAMYINDPSAVSDTMDDVSKYVAGSIDRLDPVDLANLFNADPELTKEILTRFSNVYASHGLLKTINRRWNTKNYDYNLEHANKLFDLAMAVGIPTILPPSASLVDGRLKFG